MAQTVPTREPAVIYAGDTVTWSKSLPEYSPVDGWVLKYRLINAAGRIDITAAASGSDHLVSVAATTSAAYAAGAYTWQAYVEKSGERVTIGTGSVVVKPDLAAATAGVETRSTAKQTLDALDAALIAHGSRAWTQEYEIAGRRMKFITPGDFLAMRSRLQAEVAREQAAERLAAGLPNPSKLLVRFGS